LRFGRNIASAGAQRESSFLPGAQSGTAQVSGSLSGIRNPARRKRIVDESRTILDEVTVHVQNNLSVVCGKGADTSALACRDDGGVGANPAVIAVERGDGRARVGRRPNGHVAERPVRNGRHVQRIGERVEGIPQGPADSAKSREVWPVKAGPPKAPAESRVSTTRHGVIETKRSPGATLMMVAPDCVTVRIFPPTLIVPVRAVPSKLGAAL
jgi:hypothetical protein